jgi:hypothetical protein
MRSCATLLCALLWIIVGCGPGVPEDELGNVVFEIPEVPGSEVPYELPEIEPTEPAETEPTGDALETP